MSAPGVTLTTYHIYHVMNDICKKTFCRCVSCWEMATADHRIAAYNRQCRAIPLRRFGITVAKIARGRFQQRAAYGFSNGFAASPGAKKLRLAIESALFAQPFQHGRHIHVRPYTLDIHPHRHAARYRYHCPAAGVRQAELDAATLMH